MEEYMTEMETFSQAMSRASGLSYMAKDDFSSINNFSREEAGSLSNDSNLAQSKRAIEMCKASLDRIVTMIE
eukprot:CAMPEP_0116858048 /NCGR_PEP_ID=MMETSP0418-20121206/20919_1 /TAXON_ID=1158023 /ORGANISM="Astrosyne radiata, Strain 13vi08-1A" /LENGTH=71 /DNA_ID=CAMNT_0004491853 /DNA_START=1 /DNA_END=219 /DNA_ORIENTATION=+